MELIYPLDLIMGNERQEWNNGKITANEVWIAYALVFGMEWKSELHIDCPVLSTRVMQPI